MTEKWKKSVDKEKTFAALLTDLSKALECVLHDLSIAKLNAYGFSFSSARLIQTYLSNRKQRTKLNNAHSLWEEILFGVQQGSSLEPLLFNIFTCDFFSVINNVDLASYADDNTRYIIGDGIIQIIESLKEASDELFCRFANNRMKAVVAKGEVVRNHFIKVNKLSPVFHLYQ